MAPTSTLDKTTTSNNLFLKQICLAYPQFSFRPGKKFLFRPLKTIYYVPDSTPSSFPLLLLHELSHALLGHFSYATLAERLKLELAAWQKTEQLCQKYHILYDSSFCDAELDSYRTWLHHKTLCPTCGSTCPELSLNHLYCPLCRQIIKK